MPLPSSSHSPLTRPGDPTSSAPPSEYSRTRGRDWSNETPSLIVKDAWLSDDSYITFRTVDNFVNGYGPVWNVGERVQSYTHPLWMLLLSACYLCVRNIYFV